MLFCTFVLLEALEGDGTAEMGISVVVMYQGGPADRLGATVDSLLKQSLVIEDGEAEIVVVHKGDADVSALENLSAQCDGCVRVVQETGNQNIINLISAGVSAAQGRHVLFLTEADSLQHEQTLTMLFNRVRRYKLDAIELGVARYSAPEPAIEPVFGAQKKLAVLLKPEPAELLFIGNISKEFYGKMFSRQLLSSTLEHMGSEYTQHQLEHIGPTLLLVQLMLAAQSYAKFTVDWVDRRDPDDQSTGGLEKALGIAGELHWLFDFEPFITELQEGEYEHDVNALFEHFLEDAYGTIWRLGDAEAKTLCERLERVNLAPTASFRGACARYEAGASEEL